MIRIIGERGSGKTTELLKLAQANGCTFVAPTYAMANYAEQLAKKKGMEDVRITTAHQMIHRMYGRNEKFVIDELDHFLEMLGVEAYSNGKE